MTNIVSEIPLWWLILWAAFSILISLWFYRKKSWLKEIVKFHYYLMLAARIIGLFILGLLITGILLQTRSYTKEKPLILTVVDNSASMLNYSDSNTVKKAIPHFLNTLSDNFSTDFKVLSFTLDSLIQKTDSLVFKNKKTNLYSPLKDVYERYYGRNIGSIILISDGNYNAGSNPISITNTIKLTPVYTVAVGDTIQKKDQLVSSIINNEIAFLDNKFPVEISIEGHLVNNKNTKVKLIEGDKVIAEENIKYSDEDYNLIKKTFLIEAKKLGVVEYTVKLEDLDDESNYDNNSKSFYVEILDSRSKILMIGGAPHPDIGAIKNVLAEDKNLEIISKRADDLPKNLTVFDLIIWHEPSVNITNNDLERVVNASKPILYILGPRTSGNTISKLGLSLVSRSTGQTDEVKGVINQSFNKFELSENTKDFLKNTPPLTISYGEIKSNQPIDILLNQQVGGINKKDPLLFFGSRQNVKYGVIYGEGVWRWKLAEYKRSRNNNGFKELISKIAQYLAVKSNTSQLRIQLPNDFNEDEEVIVNALFYNESFEPITSVPIEFVLENEKGEESEFDFIPGESNYILKLGYLSPGIYNWKAKAEHNNKKHEKSGSFVVKKIELESLDTKANHRLLYQMATNSNKGKFYSINQLDELISEIASREDISTVSYESYTYRKLIDYFWWFVIVIVAFATEWALRRYNGGY